jgi:putative glycosyltransferase (TIGR04372 family)
MIIDHIFHKINSSKSHPYFYLSPHVYGLNCAEDICFGLIRVKQEKKKLVILYPFDIPFIFKYKLTNKALFNIKSDFIVDQGKFTLLLSRTLMTIVYMPLRVVGLLLRKFSRFNLPESYHFPNIGVVDAYVPKKSNKKIDLTIKLNGNVCDGYEQQKLGIPKNSWFVSLHVRENGFHGDAGRREFRNSNILNYIPAISEITSRGGWVVRLGDNTMKPLPRMENVIDYPFTKYKSDFMDLCLIQNCRFYIGGQSGLCGVAELFDKNILLINMYHWLFEPMRGRGILKHVYSKRDKRYLSIKELVTRDWKPNSLDLTTDLFDEKNYVLTENSEGEISRAVLEFMDFLNNDGLSLTFKQKEFIKYRKIQSTRIIQPPRLTSPRTLTDESEMVGRYKNGVRLENAQGTLCAGFLEENW